MYKAKSRERKLTMINYDKSIKQVGLLFGCFFFFLVILFQTLLPLKQRKIIQM